LVRPLSSCRRPTSQIESLTIAGGRQHWTNQIPGQLKKNGVGELLLFISDWQLISEVVFLESSVSS
jgi:hypothetical protein